MTTNYTVTKPIFRRIHFCPYRNKRNIALFTLIILFLASAIGLTAPQPSEGDGSGVNTLYKFRVNANNGAKAETIFRWSATGISMDKPKAEYLNSTNRAETHPNENSDYSWFTESTSSDGNKLLNQANLANAKSDS